MSSRACPALLVAAPASGQGKTLFTAALARFHRNRGLRVQVFKVGPDFLDPLILERASGRPVYQLDLWMLGEAEVRRRLYDAAGDADLILVEGVMGLFDGTPSSADLAQRLGLPVLAVIDASKMAQSFGALAYGLARYRPGLPFAGVVANRTASPAHAEMLRESMPEGVELLGSFPRSDAAGLPERHLGLVTPDEVDGLERRLEHAAEAIGGSALAALPAPAEFRPEAEDAIPPRLAGVRIGIARDEAFAFIYPANLDLLRAMGAELHFFSPLHDSAPPQVDALWLPGGYPELHLPALEGNEAMRQALRAHHAAGKPLVAECGGMLYLLESLTHADGRSGRMLGLLPGRARMQEKLAAIGMQSAPLAEGEVRGHTFHYSRMETSLQASLHAVRQRGKGVGEAIYREGRLFASYLHLYFPSNPEAVAGLFLP